MTPLDLKQLPIQIVIGDLAFLGNRKLFDLKALGLFCSKELPGPLVLKTLDTVAAMRDAGILVMSGFHSKTEMECLKVLLRGTQPVIIAPAKSIIGARTPHAWSKPLIEKRLLVVSTLPKTVTRPTEETAQSRNEFVSRVADAVFIPYARPDSKTEALAKEIVSAGKPLYTIISPETINLQGLGAIEVGAFLVRGTKVQGV